MKTKHNNSLGASALQITFISISAVLLTLGAAPAKNQFEQKPPGANLAPPNAQRHPAVSESSGAAKRADARKSAGVEFWASRQSVGGREIAGFSARQAGTAQEEKLTPPAGLKPVEQEAWLAMARRQGASGGNELTSFYPERYGEAFVVEGEGIRVAVRPVGGTDVTVQIDNGQVIYRQAYAETDSVHVASAGRSEEFLFLQNECAPREFAYELSELSAGTRVELVKGEVHFTNRAGHGVKIEAPWLIEATGERRAGAVRWELEESKTGAAPRLRLVVAEGLSYPVLIDPSWVTTGSMGTARRIHTATLLQSGKVLVAGGFGSNLVSLSSAELYDPATGNWSSTGSLGTARFLHTATLLPNGKVLVAAGSGSSSDLSSAELYDPGLGFDSSWQPLLTTVLPSILPDGSELTASGSRFKGISEASGGNGAQNSSSNYPLVQLLSLANEQTLLLLVDAMTGWSDTSFTSTPITLMTTSSSGFPIGYALVTVFTNGIPSQSQFIVATPPTPPITVTFSTNPAGLSYRVDGTTYNSAHVFSWPSGSSHTISTASPQNGGGGVRYVWQNWSDNGARSHMIVPTTSTAYTAAFTTQYQLTMNAGAGGTVEPASGWRNNGAQVTISATPLNGYHFTGWTGSGNGSYSGPNNPASITMDGPITESASFSRIPNFTNKTNRRN